MTAQNTFPVPDDPPAPGFWGQGHPVTVAGGGPVGPATALGLSRRGIRTVLVEALLAEPHATVLTACEVTGAPRSRGRDRRDGPARHQRGTGRRGRDAGQSR